MSDSPASIPPDDPSRSLARHRVGDDSAPVVHIVGDEYTILVTGEETAGAFTLIDMVVPPGGGPPPHRHDFEETFVVLEGSIDATFRDETIAVGTGEAINIPANAPHRFENTGDVDAHLLCTCSPAGQDEFFIRADAGEDPVALSAEYKTELLA